MHRTKIFIKEYLIIYKILYSNIDTSEKGIKYDKVFEELSL